METPVVPIEFQEGLPSPSDCSSPTSLSPASPHSPLSRLSLRWQPHSMRFLLPPQRVYTHQYSHIYLKRLHSLRPTVLSQCKSLWGESDISVVDKIISLRPNSGQVIVIGTLYKQQNLKPSVLDEFEDEMNGREKKQVLDNYCSDEDTLVLEDESGRMDLTGLEQDLVDTLVTGLIVGVKGELDENGHFIVHEYCFPGFPAQQNRLKDCVAGIKSSQKDEMDIEGDDVQKAERTNKYIMLASGLSVGDARDPMRIQMLIDYVLGQIGSTAEIELESEIVRVVIAGGSVKPEEQEKEQVSKGFSRHLNRMARPVKDLDYCIAELATSVPVEILPGPSDPCNVTMPQQPLHKCLFPHSSRFANTFSRAPNPCESIAGDGLLVLGHSGQPINDMLKYTRNLSALDLMEHTMRWRHIAPTAPDTLPCYPLTETDPFMLKVSPHLYFCGDQDQFSTRFVREGGVNTRLVTVPRFAETGTIVLVNLCSETLECSTIEFDSMPTL